MAQLKMASKMCPSMTACDGKLIGLKRTICMDCEKAIKRRAGTRTLRGVNIPVSRPRHQKKTEAAP